MQIDEDPLEINETPCVCRLTHKSKSVQLITKDWASKPLFSVNRCGVAPRRL